MPISIVEFTAYEDAPYSSGMFDPPPPDQALIKDGTELCFSGAIGAMGGEFENEGYDLFREVFEEVDISSFLTARDDVSHVLCVFDIWWEKDYEGYESDRHIKFLGVADISKWTAQTLAVIGSPVK